MHSWALVSAVLAPVALVTGDIVGASRQPFGYSSVHNSISALAEHGASDRWIMTAALAVVGACYVITAIGLTESNPSGRWLFALGGVATVVVAALPQPAAGHVPAAGIAFAALAIWPAFSGLPTHPMGVAGTVLLVALLGWFGWQLGGQWLGLTERFVARAESLWPLVVVIALMLRDRRRELPAT
jgi:hypothetical membrane protein